MAMTERALAALVARKIETPIFTLFEQRARAQPDSPAIVDRDGATRYADLYRRALAIGASIAKQTLPGDPIVVALPTGADCVAAIMGALAAGRPYVPIDLSHPLDRQAYIVRHCGARILCSTPRHAGLLRPLVDAEMSILDLAEARTFGGAWIPEGTPDSIAYVLYTSGSTGVPKGVYQNQRGLAHDVLQYGEYVSLKSNDVLSGLYSPSVVGSVRDIHAALIFGASVAMIDLRADGVFAARRALSDNRVTVLHAMPPVFRLLWAADAAVWPDLRLIYLAGDRLFSGDLTAIRSVAPEGCRIYTGIGSTECSTLYRHWFVPPDWPTESGLLPVGLPAPDRTVDIMRPDGAPSAIGEIGEIVVTSRFIALGYWRDPERTALSFPPSAEDPLARTFRPGDLGRIRPDGLLEFHGRADTQVKIRGNLVDPGQTEAWLRALEGVSDAAVVVVDRDGPGPQLVAFIEGSEDLTTNGCRKALEATVPSQLVPSRFVRLGSLPRLANFKVNYAELLSRAEASSADGAPMADKTASSETDVARIVAEEFRRALRISSADDSAFFGELGGDSLQILKLHFALEKRLKRRLPRALFERAFSTATLAAAVASLPEVERRQDNRVKYFLFPALMGPNEHEFALRDMIDAGSFTILVYPPEVRQPLEPDISQLVEAMRVEELLETDAADQVVFVGFSFGARVAFEAATRLGRAGKAAPTLVMIDSPLRRFFFGFVSAPYLGALRAPLRNAANALTAWMAHALEPLLIRLYMARGANDGRLNIESRWAARSLLNYGTHCRWAPGRDFMAPTLLIVSENTRRFHPEQRSDLGWADICHNITAREFPGDHSDLCRIPLVAEVAVLIEKFVLFEDRNATRLSSFGHCKRTEPLQI